MPTLVEAGGLLAAADLLVEARRAYRRENIIAGQLRARAAVSGSVARPCHQAVWRKCEWPFEKDRECDRRPEAWGQRSQGVEDQGRDGCRRAVDLTQVEMSSAYRPRLVGLRVSVG